MRTDLIKYVLSVTYYLRVSYYYKCYRQIGVNIIPLREFVAREHKLDFDLDSVDIEILIRITKGHSSSPYSVWVSMKKDSKTKNLDKKVMTYKNINKRVIKLANLGVIEEIKPDAYTVNLHGRKDYKLTIKGLPYLVDHIVVFPQDLESIKEHLDKIGLDTKILAKLLDDYSGAAYTPRIDIGRL